MVKLVFENDTYIITDLLQFRGSKAACACAIACSIYNTAPHRSILSRSSIDKTWQ